MKRIALFFLLIPLWADSRTGQVSVNVQGGTFTYASFLATGGLPATWSVTATPDSTIVSNQVQVSCTGTAVAPYNGSFNLNGATRMQIPVTPIATYGFDTCTLNFADTNIQYDSVQITVTVSQNALSFSSTNADTQLDPVSTASGELFDFGAPDLAEGGPMNLEFSRDYGAFFGANQLITRMGVNWMHNFEITLTLSGTTATVTMFGAEQVTFAQSGTAWQLTTPERYGYQFATTAQNTYAFLDPRTKLIYFFAGTANTLGISAIEDRNGNQISVSTSGSATYLQDGFGRTIEINYEATSGNVASVADQANRSAAFTYTGGNLTGFTDANGNAFSFAYISATGVEGLITSRTFPNGNTPYTQTFDNIGRVLTQADSNGNASMFTYDQPQGTTEIADALGATSIDTNQNYANLLSHADPNQNTLTVTYDSNNHRNSVTDRLGNKIAASFQAASGYLASITDALSNTTTLNWQSQTDGPFTFYNLAGIQYADGTTVAYTFDSNGNVLGATDQAGNTSKYAFNSAGQLISSTDADGHATAFSYSGVDATLSSMTDGAGNTTTFSYDSAKRLNQIRLPDGNTRSFVYDKLNHLTQAVNEAGTPWNYAFNSNEQIASRTDAHNQTATISYNAQNQIQVYTDRTEDRTSYAYDANDLLKTITTPALENESVTRDTHHRIATYIDPAGNVTTYGYDKEDGLISITDALARSFSITRDALGRETKLTTPLGEAYTAAYNSLSRVTSMTTPTGVIASLEYDPRGLVNSISVGNSSSFLITMLAHDPAGLLTMRADPNGNAWNYTYDSDGRVTTSTDPLNRATNYSFDNRSRVSSIQLPLGSVSFSYDPTGNLLTRSYSDGTTINYTYDPVTGVNGGTGVALGRDFEGRITGSNGLIITRDADGRISTIIYAQDKTITYAYNSAGLLASVTDWISGSTAFTYDAAHELASITRPNGLSTKFTYDQDGRVATIAEDAGLSIAITRDASGNPVSETRSQAQAVAIASGTLPLTYDAAEEVAAYTYDADGRVTADTLRSYTWDLASRLTSYSGADGAAAFTYDAFGLRTSATNAVGTLNLVWNYATDAPSLAIVRNALGDSRYYVYLPDGTLLYWIDAVSNARHYYHFDEYGSTTLLTNDGGVITDSYGITPLGETVTQNGSSMNPFTWRGQSGAMQEGSTSLFYLRERYYDSASARFLSPDAKQWLNPLKANPYVLGTGDLARIGGTAFDLIGAALTLPSGAPARQDSSDPLVITEYAKPLELIGNHPELNGPVRKPSTADPAPADFGSATFLPFVRDAANPIGGFFGLGHFPH